MKLRIALLLVAALPGSCKNQPGNFVHVYNVHLSWNNGGTTLAESSINGLVTDMEQRFASQGRPLYPPVVTGDFNLGQQAITDRPN